jgi:hypothetical protein
MYCYVYVSHHMNKIGLFVVDVTRALLRLMNAVVTSDDDLLTSLLDGVQLRMSSALNPVRYDGMVYITYSSAVVCYILNLSNDADCCREIIVVDQRRTTTEIR